MEGAAPPSSDAGPEASGEAAGVAASELAFAEAVLAQRVAQRRQGALEAGAGGARWERGREGAVGARFFFGGGGGGGGLGELSSVFLGVGELFFNCQLPGVFWWEENSLQG